MRVEASGYQFIFPQHCACCDTKADTALTVSASKSSGKKVVRTKTNTWDFPYCTQCKKHIEAADTANILTGVVCVISLVAAGYLGSKVGAFIGVIGLVAALFTYIKLMAHAKSMLKASCACIGKAVGFLDWDGTRQVFKIVSHEYARKFMVANSRKLINVSPEARHLLEGAGYEHRANSIQSARRNRK